jgi:hypothetical protein
MKARPGRYGDGSEDVPLFDDVPTQGFSRERMKPAVTVAWAHCPMHESTIGTGLVRQGIHLVWRAHYQRIGKTSVPCRASGVSLCVAPALGVDGNPPMMRITLTKSQIGNDTGMRAAKCPHPMNQP